VINQINALLVAINIYLMENIVNLFATYKIVLNVHNQMYVFNVIMGLIYKKTNVHLNVIYKIVKNV